MTLLSRNSLTGNMQLWWHGCSKFKQLVPLLTNKDVSLFTRGKLHRNCVWS